MLSCALPFVTIFLHSYSPEYARNLLPNTIFLPVFHYHSCRRCREGVIYECEVIFYARSVFIRCNQLPERHCAISFYPDILRRRQRKERLDTETGSGRKAHPLITSRQITADAQAKKLGADRWIDLDKLLDRSEWEFECLYSDITRCVVCTNFGFAKFVRNRFSPSDSQTYLWNKFDLIVLDECHSLSTDATFANDPFYIEKFIRFAIKQPSKCKFIL